MYTVNVSVQDINDNPPLFNSPFSASFEEGQTGFIVTPNVADADSGTNALFSLSIVSGNIVAFSIVNGVSIHAQIDLDYETQRSYVLLLEAVDQGQPPLSSRTNFTIEVVNVNDVMPVFIVPAPSTTELAQIFENGPVGQLFMFSLSASDGDDPPFNEVRFYFAPDAPQSAVEHFYIDPDTGNISVAVPLDREAIPEFLFDVHAFDGTFNTTGSISVQVLDVNDNLPVFQPPFQFSVEENATNNTVIGTISFTDRDIPPNDDASLILMDSSLPFRLQRINGQSAELLVAAGLDFETQQNYSVVVIAFDEDGQM